MKKTMIIAIALASITATAQTSAPAAAPKKKAAVAAKKSTAAKKAATQVAAAQAPAMPATTDVVAQLPEGNKVASADIQAPSAGTSAADVAKQAAPAKKWSAKAQLFSTTDHTNTQNIQNLTTFSGSYKVLPKLSLKVAQTFETLTNGRDTSDATRELTKSNNFRTSFTDLGVSTSFAGVGGSDDIALSVNFKVMGGESEYTTTGGYSGAYNFVETNLSVPFTLSPKWSLSVDSQWRTVDNRPKWLSIGEQIKAGNAAADQAYEISQNSNRLLVIPSLTYTINDYVSVYHAAGWIGSFKDAEAVRRNAERIYMETGVTLTPVKNLTMTFMVDQDKAVYASPSSGYEVSGYSLYKPTEATGGETFDAVSYEAVIAYVF